MEAAIAAAMFLGLPVALWLLVRRSRRKTQRSDGWLEPRVAELEALAVSEDRWRDGIEQRLTALEQTQAPLYRVQ